MAVLFATAFLTAFLGAPALAALAVVAAFVPPAAVLLMPRFGEAAVLVAERSSSCRSTFSAQRCPASPPHSSQAMYPADGALASAQPLPCLSTL
ncbi:hypothetical protein XVE_2330 [Xanthomonas vesicatoria ATCC 35937]|uniref:Secreted protein n=1 Tax=Xanthomonas vesicatoria ATCC 35937 TaxID=925775 RepID=F0BDW1_9XANT|nr:hypothetical protein XVE_2330 [Xanthomonas vesicatoria ATCC 35937]